MRNILYLIPLSLSGCLSPDISKLTEALKNIKIDPEQIDSILATAQGAVTGSGYKAEAAVSAAVAAWAGYKWYKGKGTLDEVIRSVGKGKKTLTPGAQEKWDEAVENDMPSAVRKYVRKRKG